MSLGIDKCVCARAGECPRFVAKQVAPRFIKRLLGGGAGSVFVFVCVRVCVPAFQCGGNTRCGALCNAMYYQRLMAEWSMQ